MTTIWKQHLTQAAVASERPVRRKFEAAVHSDCRRTYVKLMAPRPNSKLAIEVICDHYIISSSTDGPSIP